MTKCRQIQKGSMYAYSLVVIQIGLLGISGALPNTPENVLRSPSVVWGWMLPRSLCCVCLMVSWNSLAFYWIRSNTSTVRIWVAKMYPEITFVVIWCFKNTLPQMGFPGGKTLVSGTDLFWSARYETNGWRWGGKKKGMMNRQKTAMHAWPLVPLCVYVKCWNIFLGKQMLTLCVAGEVYIQSCGNWREGTSRCIRYAL